MVKVKMIKLIRFPITQLLYILFRLVTAFIWQEGLRGQYGSDYDTIGVPKIYAIVYHGQPQFTLWQCNFNLLHTGAQFRNFHAARHGWMIPLRCRKHHAVVYPNQLPYTVWETHFDILRTGAEFRTFVAEQNGWNAQHVLITFDGKVFN